LDRECLFGFWNWIDCDFTYVSRPYEEAELYVCDLRREED